MSAVIAAVTVTALGAGYSAYQGKEARKDAESERKRIEAQEKEKQEKLEAEAQAEKEAQARKMRDRMTRGAAFTTTFAGKKEGMSVLGGNPTIG